METLRKLRFFLYPLAFIATFIFGVYLTFPTDVLRDGAENILTGLAFSMGPRGRGVPKVKIDDASLWRISGITVSGLKVEWPKGPSAEPVAIEIDRAAARVSILSLLTKQRKISATASLYRGFVDASLRLKNNELSSIGITGRGIDLGKTTFLTSLLGAPLEGFLGIAIDLDAKTRFFEDGAGSIRFELDQLAYGPGAIKLPMGGFVSSIAVPRMGLGKLVSELAMGDGELTSKEISLSGGDVEGGLSLSIDLGPNAMLSRLNGNGWFRIKPEFISANETLKMLYDLLPELKEAKAGDGKVGFAIRGSLARPSFGLRRQVSGSSDNKQRPPQSPG